MKWDELLNANVDTVWTGQKKTNVECPTCGRRVYLDDSVTLTSYPEKYRYWCSCGWVGFAPVRWTEVDWYHTNKNSKAVKNK